MAVAVIGSANWLCGCFHGRGYGLVRILWKRCRGVECTSVLGFPRNRAGHRERWAMESVLRCSNDSQSLARWHSAKQYYGATITAN
jgi:hypothetical protein